MSRHWSPGPPRWDLVISHFLLEHCKYTSQTTRKLSTLQALGCFAQSALPQGVKYFSENGWNWRPR